MSRAAKMQYTVTDNFLPDADASHLCALLTGDELPWYANQAVVAYDDSPNPQNYQLTHTFYDHMMVRSSFYPALEPLLARLPILSLIRIKANLLPHSVEQYAHGYHVDLPDQRIITCVYYANDNNGVTMFDSGEIVESRRNRLLSFPAPMMHTGTTATDTSYRILLNINYLPELN